MRFLAQIHTRYQLRKYSKKKIDQKIKLEFTSYLWKMIRDGKSLVLHLHTRQSCTSWLFGTDWAFPVPTTGIIPNFSAFFWCNNKCPQSQAWREARLWLAERISCTKTGLDTSVPKTEGDPMFLKKGTQRGPIFPKKGDLKGTFFKQKGDLTRSLVFLNNFILSHL